MAVNRPRVRTRESIDRERGEQAATDERAADVRKKVSDGIEAFHRQIEKLIAGDPAAFAAAIGIPRQTVSDWRKRVPNGEQLLRIAIARELSIDSLFGLSESEPLNVALPRFVYSMYKQRHVGQFYADGIAQVLGAGNTRERDAFGNVVLEFSWSQDSFLNRVCDLACEEATAIENANANAERDAVIATIEQLRSRLPELAEYDARLHGEGRRRNDRLRREKGGATAPNGRPRRTAARRDPPHAQFTILSESAAKDLLFGASLAPLSTESKKAVLRVLADIEAASSANASARDEAAFVARVGASPNPRRRRGLRALSPAAPVAPEKYRVEVVSQTDMSYAAFLIGGAPAIREVKRRGRVLNITADWTGTRQDPVTPLQAIEEALRDLQRQGIRAELRQPAGRARASVPRRLPDAAEEFITASEIKASGPHDWDMSEGKLVDSSTRHGGR